MSWKCFQFLFFVVVVDIRVYSDLVYIFRLLEYPDSADILINLIYKSKGMYQYIYAWLKPFSCLFIF